MSEVEVLSQQIKQLEHTVKELERAILEMRVALLGGLDGRPGILAQLANFRSDINNINNAHKMCEMLYKDLDQRLDSVQQESWITKGKLIGYGGILGAFLGKMIDFIKP